MGKQRLAAIFNLHIEPFGSDVQKSYLIADKKVFSQTKRKLNTD